MGVGSRKSEVRVGSRQILFEIADDESRRLLWTRAFAFKKKEEEEKEKKKKRKEEHHSTRNLIRFNLGDWKQSKRGRLSLGEKFFFAEGNRLSSFEET